MKNIVYSFMLTLALVACIPMQAKEVTLSTNQRLLAAGKGLGYGAFALANGYLGSVLVMRGLETVSTKLEENSTRRNKFPISHPEVLREIIKVTSFSIGLTWATIAAGKRSYQSFKDAFVGKAAVEEEIEMTTRQKKAE